MLFAIGASLSVLCPTSSILLLHQVLIEHFLVADLVVDLIIELQFDSI